MYPQLSTPGAQNIMNTTSKGNQPGLLLHRGERPGQVDDERGGEEAGDQIRGDWPEDHLGRGWQQQQQ